MVDVKCNKGSIELYAEGSTPELYADVMTIIHTVYSQIYSHDTINATIFRNAIESDIQDAFILTDKEVKGEC